MIKIANGIPAREALPVFLYGLSQESLYDLSWTDPSLGVQDLAWWPERNQETPYDPETQQLGSEILTMGDRVVIVTHEIIGLTKEQLNANLAKRKESLTGEIDRIRYSKIYQASIPYLFPGDTDPDGVQMRDDIDRQNIQNHVTDAMIRDPGDTMYFMPTSNNLKTMTAQQTVDMGQFIKVRGDRIVAYAWALKAQVNSAEIDTFAKLESIDINSGWPE